MAITYEQAREVVRAQTEPGWSVGTYCLDDRQIVENAEFWVFAVGAREFLVDGNDTYAIAGGVPTVGKADGQLRWRPSVEVGTDDTVTARPNPHPTLVTAPAGTD